MEELTRYLGPVKDREDILYFHLFTIHLFWVTMSALTNPLLDDTQSTIRSGILCYNLPPLFVSTISWSSLITCMTNDVIDLWKYDYLRTVKELRISSVCNGIDEVGEWVLKVWRGVRSLTSQFQVWRRGWTTGSGRGWRRRGSSETRSLNGWQLILTNHGTTWPTIYQTYSETLLSKVR